MRYTKLLTLFVCVGYISASLARASAAELSIEKQPFGATSDGTAVDLYTLTNTNGLRVKITSYEGIVVALFAPDQQGNLKDIVLGYDTLDQYIQNAPYFGGIHDPVSDRFKGTVWDVEETRSEQSVGLNLSAVSQVEDVTLSATVTYTFTNDNELKILYSLSADKPIKTDLTNAIYFNLAGAGAREILDHEIMINGDSFYPLGEETLQPISSMRGVWGTPMDYTEPKPIRPNLKQEDEQTRLARGYNHLWRLNPSDEPLPLSARIVEPSSKRVLEIRTNATGMWFETGNFLDPLIQGKEGQTYRRHYGFTLEARNLPDPVAGEEVSAHVVKPGKDHTHTVLYKFFAL